MSFREMRARPTDDELAEFAAHLPVGAARMVIDTWRRGGDVHALAFVVDGLLFDQFCERLRRKAQS